MSFSTQRSADSLKYVIKSGVVRKKKKLNNEPNIHELLQTVKEYRFSSELMQWFFFCQNNRFLNTSFVYSSNDTFAMGSR